MSTTTAIKKISAGGRLAAMLLDHFFMTMIGMLFFIPGIISDFSNAFKVSHEQASPDIMGGSWAYLGILGFALYFCKDIINGRSIAKRLLKLQVVDNTTGEVASPMQCFVRNLFCIIWPIEVAIALTNTSRRLGDQVAGTKLVPYDPALEQPKFNTGKIMFPLIIAYGMMLLLFQLLPKPGIAGSSYIETSYNQPASKEMEKILFDSLGQYFTPDIRVYDTVKNSKLKYVSAILRLSKNYIEEDSSYQQLHAATTRLIYSKFPKETCTGKLKYIFQQSGHFQGRNVPIGTEIK